MITIKIFIIIYLIVDLINLILHRKLGNFLKNNPATRSILEKKYNGRKEMIDSMDEIAWCEYLRSLIPIYHIYELFMLSGSLLALKLIPEETMKEVVKKTENDDTW